MVNDPSDPKESTDVQETLYQTEQALRSSEERYRSVVEHSPAGILLIDDQATIIYANDEACRILDRACGEIVGWRFTDFLHPDEQTQVFDRYARRQRGEELPSRYEIKILRKDGEVRQLEISATTYRNSRGAARSIAQLLDITQRKQAEEALKQYARELEIRNAELDTFADSVAHDLRNPLSTIIGFAEVLTQSDLDLPPERVDEVLASIARLGHKMNSMIEELLLFAHVPKTAVETTPVNMKPLVHNALERLHQMIVTAGAEVTAPETWPLAMGYGPWIEEVWANYISNAVRYGGTPPRIELGAERLPEGRVRYWVRDNGDGIPPAQQAHLFDDIVEHKEHQAKSHGLGLRIVKRIIDKLGGEVEVTSENRPGRGSTFSFILPQAPPAPSPKR